MGRTLPVSFAKAANKMGRMQQNNNKFYNNNKIKKASYVPLNDRLDTEWDLRIDLTNGLTATAIVDSIRSKKEDVQYCLYRRS